MKFEIILGKEDTEKLFAIKRRKGKAKMTGNDFAKELLQKTLQKMYPGQTVLADKSDEWEW